MRDVGISSHGAIHQIAHLLLAHSQLLADSEFDRAEIATAVRSFRPHRHLALVLEISEAMLARTLRHLQFSDNAVKFVRG